MRAGFSKEKLGWGAGEAMDGGKAAIVTAPPAPPPPHQDLWDTHRNRQKLAQKAKLHGVLDRLMFNGVKTALNDVHVP